MSPLLIGLLITVAVLGGLGYWLVQSGRWAQSKEFVGETRSEMKKVSFPTRDEVTSTTIIVIVTSIIFAVFLWLADLVILHGYDWIIRVTS
jgi:preprotein translocase subunit SecE